MKNKEITRVDEGFFDRFKSKPGAPAPTGARLNYINDFTDKLINAIQSMVEGGRVNLLESNKFKTNVKGYEKLNAVFESIMALTEAPIMISDYILKTWYPTLMKTIDWETEYKDEVEKLAMEIERNWTKAGGFTPEAKKSVEKLANLTYSITMHPTGGRDPKVDQAKKAIDRLGLTPAELADLIAKLSPTPTPAPGGTP